MTAAHDLTSLLATMVAAPDSMACEFAASLAQEHFGVAGSVERLTGERDENFLVRAKASRYVLKVAPIAEEPGVTDLSTAALLHIERADPTLPCPRICRDREGRGQVFARDAQGRTRTVRLLTWLPGSTLRAAGSHPARQTASARLAARIGRALADFEHPTARRALIWDLRVFPRLAPLLEELQDFPRRAWVIARMAEFEGKILPALAGLCQQVIHNDLNDRNVLVDPAEPSCITGVIDFGDMVHGPLVFDLAILAAACAGDDAPLEQTIAQLEDAYCEVAPLDPEAARLLRPLVGARILMGALIPSWHRRRNPDGRHYERVTREFVLKRLALAESLFGE